jgi:hypothetical protein
VPYPAVKRPALGLPSQFKLALATSKILYLFFERLWWTVDHPYMQIDVLALVIDLQSFLDKFQKPMEERHLNELEVGMAE